MRWLALVVVPGAVAAVFWAATASHRPGPRLELSIAPGIPTPDPGDTNILGVRSWGVASQLKVRARRSCGDVEVRTTAQRVFDRRALSGTSDAETFDLGALRARSTKTLSVGGSGYAGESVLVRVAASCDGHTKHAERRFVLPAESCFGGPIHVYAVHGTVTASDGNADYPPRTLRPGDLVGDETFVNVPRGGHVLLGATECNNFHVELGPGQYMTGTYDAGGAGDAFSGRNALVVGDVHTGGFAIEGKGVVEPLGRGCRTCSPPAVSFEVRTQSARRATIRVYRGTVRVISGEHLNHVERALAGQQIDVLCKRDCALTRPRLWQPNEPWTTLPEPRALPVPRVLQGGRPSKAALAPARSHVTVHDLRAASGAPEQLAAVWERNVRSGAGRDAGNLQQQTGLWIWQRGGPSVWRRVFAWTFPVYDAFSVTTGDVTADGHPDLLVMFQDGSGACGPREILATVHARIRRVFYRNECESFVRLKDGVAQLDEPVGRCPVKEGGAHCFGGVAHIVERWNGRRLVVASRRVRCNWPRLDPATDCNRRKVASR